QDVGTTKNYLHREWMEIPSLEGLGFEKTDMVFRRPSIDPYILENYKQYRDFPAMEHGSQLGIALRFGTISVRQCVRAALEYEETWLAPLIWREFFMQLSYPLPQAVEPPCKARYGRIEWRNAPPERKPWTAGATGYGLSAGGLRQVL